MRLVDRLDIVADQLILTSADFSVSVSVFGRKIPLIFVFVYFSTVNEFRVFGAVSFSAENKKCIFGRSLDEWQ